MPIKSFFDEKPFVTAGLVIFWLACTQAYLLPKAFDVTDGLDFRLIWLAGRLWGEGLDPYSQSFALAYASEFGPGPVSHFWVYPPYWYPISMLLALFPFKTALAIWNLVNLAGLAIGATVVAVNAINRNPWRQLEFACAVFGLLCLVQATPISIAIGQTSIIFFVGLCLFWWGYRKSHLVLLTVGITLLVLKPHFALPFIAICFFSPRYFLCLVMSGGFICLIIVGYIVFLSNDLLFGTFFDNLSQYYSLGAAASLPFNILGFTNILDALGLEIPIFVSFTIGVIFVVSIAYLESDLDLRCMAGLVSLLFFQGLHTYDLIIAFALLVSISSRNRLILWSSVPVYFVFFRPGNLAHVTGGFGTDQIFPGTFIASLASALFFLIFTYAVLVRYHTKQKRIIPVLDN